MQSIINMKKMRNLNPVHEFIFYSFLFIGKRKEWWKQKKLEWKLNLSWELKWQHKFIFVGKRREEVKGRGYKVEDGECGLHR